MPNPFTNRLHTTSWEWPVAGVSLLLGVMVSLGWINEKNRSSRWNRIDPSQQQGIIQAKNDPEVVQKLAAEVSKLQAENTKLQNGIADSSKSSKVLNDGLQQTKLFAGLTDVEGPGITITMRDSEKEDIPPMDRIIHDGDVIKVVNELWSSGAEAVEVNGHRVVGSTSFRCVGPVIHVDGVPIASPVMVRAIGDAVTLVGAMQLPGGILDELNQQDTSMVQMDKVAKHRFKAFNGTTGRKFLTVPKESS